LGSLAGVVLDEHCLLCPNKLKKVSSRSQNVPAFAVSLSFAYPTQTCIKFMFEKGRRTHDLSMLLCLEPDWWSPQLPATTHTPFIIVVTFSPQTELHVKLKLLQDMHCKLQTYGLKSMAAFSPAAQVFFYHIAVAAQL
jgi:hypothetical protein